MNKTNINSITTNNTNQTNEIGIKQLAIDKAYSYYVKGLTAKETAKLLDVSERTVQRWIAENDFKGKSIPKSIQTRAFQLAAKGLTYTQIAKALKISKGTVYNHIKTIKEKNEQDEQG